MIAPASHANKFRKAAGPAVNLNDPLRKLPDLGGNYACLECGKKFKTSKSAERAVNCGCPNCGGSDIDLAPGSGFDLK